MTVYLLRRILHGLISVIVVVAVVMILIYSLMDRNLIFAQDQQYTKQNGNSKVVYRYKQWSNFGYLDYVTYTDWLNQLVKNGEIDAETREKVGSIGRTPEKDSDAAAPYVARFKEYYESQGYEVMRLDAIMQGRKLAPGGAQQYFAFKDRPLASRLLSYFGHLITVDTVRNVDGDIGERGFTFTLHDPAYGGEKFSPAILGNGTNHKYLLWCDNKFPFIHQNLVTISLGKSYSINTGIDVAVTMTRTQGAYVMREITYPTGLVEDSADDLHTATYSAGSLAINPIYAARFTDDYTNVDTIKDGMSKMGYSFVIGIISTVLAYLIGMPMAIWMAQKKDKLVDQIGSVYVVFITAMPSLAYIFLVKALGGKLGLPTTFDMSGLKWTMYLLPVISLALRPIGSNMRWLRRFMVDQQNADYVKFARAGGLSEGEIFRNHILKNAAIPIIHGIPAAILFSLVGALITERVYVVPGVGGLLINAINFYDNGVIVGVTMFYAILSIVSVILGDVLMSMVDPRISFSSKAR